MRIDHIVTTLGAGGAEALVASLAAEQAKSGHEVRVWTMFSGPLDSRNLQDRRVADLTAAGVDVAQIGSGPRAILSSAREIRRHMPRQPTSDHVVHCHNAATASTGILGARGAPVVLTIHSTTFNFPAPLWRLIGNRIAAVAAVSEASRKAFSPHISKSIRVIENGINLPIESAKERQFDSDDVTLLAVGNLRPEKNYGRLVSSFHMLLPNLERLGIRVRLLIAGAGEEAATLEDKIASLELEDSICLLGIRDDVRALMLDSDIFVMSSNYEGQPIALLEALSAGLPSVVTPFDSASDILKEGEIGSIADAFTAEALAEALLEIVLDQERRRFFSEAGISRAKKYSIPRCADEYLDLYESVL